MPLLLYAFSHFSLSLLQFSPLSLHLLFCTPFFYCFTSITIFYLICLLLVIPFHISHSPLSVSLSALHFLLYLFRFSCLTFLPLFSSSLLPPFSVIICTSTSPLYPVSCPPPLLFLHTVYLSTFSFPTVTCNSTLSPPLPS